MSPAAEKAYREIRRAILTGEMHSGETLQEARLAERIGVSRTPVREALKRLGAESLVVLEQYRRARVAQFTQADVAEIFRLRALLEGEAAGRAASRITDAAIASLEALEDEMEEMFDRLGWPGHLEDFDRLNNQFHAIIFRAAQSPRLERILASSLELPASIFNEYDEPNEERARRTYRQHRELIAALRMRNASWAEAEMRAHLLSILHSEG
jgi:DNA-binding GntR family transcriptional regulator